MNILVAVFAIISLLLAIVEWEASFEYRGDNGTDTSSVSFFTDLVVALVSFMGFIAIILKYYFESIWQQYKNPVAFYKSMVMHQVGLGMVNAEDLTENFKIEN